MVHSGKNLVEVLGDLMEVLEGELTIVQLTVTEYVVDQPVDHTLNSRRSRLRQRTAGSLHHIGQHDKACLLGLGLGSGVAVIVDVDRGKLRSLGAQEILR